MNSTIASRMECSNRGSDKCNVTLGQFRNSLLNENYWYFRFLSYVFAPRLASILYRAGATPNQVTLFGISLVIPAVWLNIIGWPWAALLIFHLFFLIDCVDGVLARGAGMKSEMGAYLDDMAHYLFHTPYILSLAYAAFISGELQRYLEGCGYKVTLLHNPFYAVTNSIASLWFARDHLEGDVFITNGDTYFHPSIHTKLIQNNNKYVFGVDESKDNDLDYRVTLADGEVKDMGKDISDEETMAEYIGMALIRKEGMSLFKELLERVIHSGNYELWWEDLFVELIAKNEKISYADVTGELWFEVDEIKDYRKYQKYF